MARTIQKIPMNQKSVEEIYQIISTILYRYGYQNKIVKGENVWAKGDGIVIKMCCFSFVFSDDSMFIQAWLHDALLGESDLEGFVAKLAKRKMYKIIEEIREEIVFY